MRGLGPLTALVAALLAVPAWAKGPSFDCAKAARPDERAICASQKLAVLDQRLAGLFAQVQGCSGMGSRDVNNVQQGAWLRRRARCGSDAACIAARYRARIAQYAPRAAKAAKFSKAGECPGPV